MRNIERRGKVTLKSRNHVEGPCPDLAKGSLDSGGPSMEYRGEHWILWLQVTRMCCAFVQ